MALKALSKDEELKAVPGDQPVLVQLPEFIETPEQAEVPEKKKPDLKIVEKDDDPVKVLTEQMEAMKTANAAEIAREREERRKSDLRADQAERDRLAALADKAETESDAVTSGLAAAQAEQVAAKAALKSAGEAGDWEAMGEAQARIARSASDIREFERAAAQIADDKKRAPAEQTNQRQLSVNEAIDGNPQLLDAERVWLKAHPEAIIDPARNKELDVAYVRATREGLSRGTPAYFEYIEKFMGYKTADKQQDDDMTVAAPPSRNDRGNDGKPTGGKIMLSPEERDLAKSMGVTDIEYARQKQNFDVARKAEPDKYR